VETARVATKADPASADSQYVLATVLSTKRNNVEAIAALNESLRLNPRFVPAQLLLSRLKLATGDVVGAVKSAQDAKKNAPANPDAQLALARSLIAQRNITEAQPEVAALLAKYPQRAEPQALNGFILLQKKQTAEARAAFERALKLDPDYPEAYEGLLALDFRANRIADAVKRIDARLAQKPNNPTLLVVSARTYAAARQPEKSETALRRVIELDPNNMPAYLLLGQSYIAQKKMDQAVAQYDEVSKRTQNVSASTMAALLVQLQRRDDEALKRYEAIVAANQGAPVAANNLAWMYAEKGVNLNMALQLAQQAKSQLPNSADVSDTLGWVYIKKGLPQLAIGPLEESVAKVPENAMFRYHLGLAYAQAGQKDKARAALERALQLSPQFDGANSARATLASL
jgi:tetratricopeptide (TPR) repeat protein